MNLLLLKGYNNYFNRIHKEEADIASYKTAVGTGNFLDLTDMNFNPNDGVATELIVGKSDLHN